ncbi:MAG: S41 family peptidase, partial [Acidobacteria bacterium]|nr:S41 family peptidase [Acidobacteriota bacterium]
AFEFKVLPNNIGYVSLQSFENAEVSKEFEKNFEAISGTSALILDIRNNGGGNSSFGWSILGMLTDKDFKTSKWHTRSYKPAFRAWGRQEEIFGEDSGDFPADRSKYYSRPVVVLTGPATFSAAEDFAVAFDAMKRGLIIGEPTGGSTGQPLFFRLPGGGSARVTTKRDSYPDGKEFVGRGVIPDIVVKPNIPDIRARRDTVLEAARSELAKNLK